MGYADEYLKLRKKKETTLSKNTLTSTATKSKSYADEYLESRARKTNELEQKSLGLEFGSFAPVKTAQSPLAKTYTPERKWFQSGAFEDGYQYGDVAKAIVTSTADLEANLIAGVTGIAEKAIDAGAYVVGGVGGIFGADDFKRKTADFIKKNTIDEEKIGYKAVSSKLLSVDEIEENSVFGEKSDSLAQSTGQLGGTIALQAVGVPWFVTTGVTSFGGATEEALNDGATYGQAGVQGAIQAGADILTEKLFAGSGLGEKGLINLGGLTKGISNKVVRTLANFGVDVAAEGSEEVVASVASRLGSALYKEENLDELLFSEEAVDEYIESFIGGAVLGGGMNAGKLSKSLKTKTDYRTGLTETDQKVFDKVYNDAITKAEKDGKKLTSKEKSEIYDNILERVEKGDIDIDTIEEVLGGNTFEEYKTLTNKEKSLTDEISQLENLPNSQITVKQSERLAEARKELKNLTGKDELKSKLSDEVYGIAKDGKLVESYNEKIRKSQAFEVDLSKYTGKQKEAVERAVKSGVLNNTNKSHALVDTLSRIEADKGIVFDYADNAKLKESGFALDGKTVNGFVKDGAVTLNVQSAKAWQSTVGHEISHILEGTEHYNALRDSLFKYAESKGELASRRAELTELYKDMDADIDAELTADLVGDYLFNDSNFIKNLTTNKNLFQKIYDEVKYLYKVATGKEKNEIEKVKREFDKAWKELSVTTNTETDGKTKYSVSNVDGIDYVQAEKNIFTKEDGTLATERDVFNSLVGKKIALSDGEVEIVKRLPNMDMYNELSRRYPKSLGGVKNVKQLNSDVNYNMEELLSNSEMKTANEPDKGNRHAEQGIVDFDTRTVKFYDGNKAYDIEFSIATLQDGKKVAYAKKYFGYDAELTKKIQTAEGRSNQSPFNQQSVSEGIITQNPEMSSENAKLSISDDTKKSDYKQKQLDIILETNPATTGTPLKDLYLAPTQEAAPVAVEQNTPVEDIAPVKDVAEDVMDDGIAPMTEEEANAMQDEKFHTVVDMDAPPEMEAPIYNEIIPESPFADRDEREVGNRKVKAYMYENPEVKPFFQTEAETMLSELSNSTKGERWYDDTLYYETSGEQGWFGTNRKTSPEIASLLDNFKYTYADIEKGLKAIIEDNGKENNAISKRIEFQLDKRLREGYTDFASGITIPPNTEYINLLNEKQVTEYSDEAFEKWAQSLTEDDFKTVEPEIDAPVRDDVAPVVDEAPMDEEMPMPTDAPMPNEIAIDKDSFFSEKALKLYEEVSNMRKGTRVSRELSYLLDTLDLSEENKANSYRSLKTALLNIKARPNQVVNERSAIEATAREMIDNSYKKAVTDVKKQRERGNRKQLHTKIVDNVKSKFADNGLDFDEVLKNAKNLSTFSTVDNTPQRVMEKSLGYKEGQILADETVNKVAQNETEGIKWLNSFTDRKNGFLAQISKQYNIKPASKESAAAQMYAEGFYVDENNDIVEYGDAELEIDFPNEDVRNNIKGLASDPRIRQIYDETLNAINESRTRNAYPEIQKLDNYFLHFRAMEDTFSKLGLPFNPNDIRAKDLPTDLNGVTADLKPGQPYFASAKHRTGKRTSFDLLGGLERYLTSAKNQIYHIDDIQTLRALRNYIADNYGQANGLEGIDALTEEEAQERIEQVYGSHLSTFAKFLNEEANVLAGKTALIDRGLEGIIGRRGMTFFDTLNRQVGSNMVGFNISSSLTNFIPVAQTFAKTNKFDFIKAFAQTVSNKFGSIYGKGDNFAENSPVIIRRKGADKFYRTPFQKFGDAGYVFMGAVDSISTELIARTKFNELTRKGMSEQQAHFETDKWVSRMMGDRSLGQMPQLYNSKMLGLVTKFQLEVRNQLDSQFYDTVQEAKVSNEEIESKLAKNAKTAAKVTSTFVQLAVAQHLFGAAFEAVAGYNPAFDIISVLSTLFGFDDDEESEDTALDNIEQGFLELLGDLPYTSTLTGGRIPISSALPVTELIKGVDSYGNEKSRLETIKEAAPYYFLPTGYGQIKKTVGGLEMFNTDEDHPIAGSYTDSGALRFPIEDTVGNRIKAGIFGQYANDNAREYFDNEYAPLKEKQIEEYMDVDLPIGDYWKYREGLKGLKSNAEKADYINSLDIKDWQKNLLMNNILDRKEDVDMSNYDDYSDFEEFDYAQKNPEKYEFFKANGISYKDYANADEDGKSAYTWAFNNPEGYTVSKVVADDVVKYRSYTSDLNDIKADKDVNGKSITGSRKEKVIEYINSLDADYESKIILFKSEYPSDDTYNTEIINHINSREDLTYEERVTIFTELGFAVKDGYVY